MKLDWEEENDRPRGIVAKANRYAASKVPIHSIELSEPGLTAMQGIYLMHFNTFIAGAHAALEIHKDTVFVVTRDFYYEGSDLMQVFSDRDAAVAWIAECLKNEGFDRAEHKTFLTYEVWDCGSWGLKIHRRVVQ